jgi:hypothetical protein
MDPVLIELTATPSRRSFICFASSAESAPTPLLGKPGLPLIKVLMISNPAGAEMFVSSVRKTPRRNGRSTRSKVLPNPDSTKYSAIESSPLGFPTNALRSASFSPTDPVAESSAEKGYLRGSPNRCD